MYRAKLLTRTPHILRWAHFAHSISCVCCCVSRHSILSVSASFLLFGSVSALSLLIRTLFFSMFLFHFLAMNLIYSAFFVAFSLYLFFLLFPSQFVNPNFSPQPSLTPFPPPSFIFILSFGLPRLRLITPPSLPQRSHETHIFAQFGDEPKNLFKCHRPYHTCPCILDLLESKSGYTI